MNDEKTEYLQTGQMPQLQRQPERQNLTMQYITVTVFYLCNQAK